jgi:hypothetical protein
VCISYGLQQVTINALTSYGVKSFPMARRLTETDIQSFKKVLQPLPYASLVNFVNKLKAEYVPTEIDAWCESLSLRPAIADILSSKDYYDITTIQQLYDYKDNVNVLNDFFYECEMTKEEEEKFLFAIQVIIHLKRK